MRKDLKPRDRLIVSMDVSSKQEVIDLCTKIAGKINMIKIGLELIYSQGLSIIDTVKSFGYQVMLDAKLHDIPNTVGGAGKAIASLNVSALTIHTLGGAEMIHAARKAIDSQARRLGVIPPLLLGVTVLTSLDDQNLQTMGFGQSYLETVKKLAVMGNGSGLDGIICSPREVRMLREELGNAFYIVTPGIRLQGDSSDDQKRIATPGQAIEDGVDFLVAGRSITGKNDIGGAINQYLQILEEGT